MYQAIETHFVGPSNVKGARYVAVAEAGICAYCGHIARDEPAQNDEVLMCDSCFSQARERFFNQILDNLKERE